MTFPGERSRAKPWLIASVAAIGWALVTMVVLHLISSRDPVFDTLSSYAYVDRGTGMLGASVLSLSIGSLTALGALAAAGIPLSRTTKLLFVLWSLGLAAAAIFPASYPEYPDPVSGEIHLYACLIAFLSLPAAGFTLRDNLRGTPAARQIGRLAWGSAASLIVFGLSFIFVRLADIPFFKTLTDIMPVGVTQRLSLVVHVILIAGMLKVASAAHRVGELRGVTVETGQSSRVQEDNVLVGRELAFGGPLDQRGTHLAGVHGIERDPFRAAEKPYRVPRRGGRDPVAGADRAVVDVQTVE
ncbi:hypothetical protein B0293_08060 [Amycolatopsis azurea DSM 43854]|uniref:DUF998 domain-containing protein n=1 Tax=Amycolatopsis azurea DSM 43854 TaxID=1238180 RepID=A0ABX3JJA9_9PSEU|nr:hypothetical protein B0293_08060 [Amycolatopsis azurea DSM 43854]